jgi:serine phosphatase RsbU (regulator of sigma subunit)
VLLATDSLREIRNGKDEDFSWGTLSELWQHCRGRSAEETLNHLFAGLKEFSAGRAPHDDITVVVKAISTIVLCKRLRRWSTATPVAQRYST